jgi:diguanylate cyclase (GGDEF)-like protein/PAS domain S-box-containing protein
MPADDYSGAGDAAGFRLLVERSDHMIGRHHPNGRFFFVSPGCAQVLGCSPDDLLGTDPYALAHPDDLAIMANVHRAVSKSDEPVSATARLRRHDRTYAWCHVTMRGLRDPQTGALLEIHSSTRDATDWSEGEATRLREIAARAALAENEALLRVAKAVARDDSPEELFGLVTEEAGRLLAADTARVAQFVDGQSVVLGTWGPGGPPIGRRFPLRGERPVARVFRTGKPARSDSYAELRTVDATTHGVVPPDYSSGIAAPIVVAQRLWGVLLAARVGPGQPFGPGEEDRLAHFAELVSLAIVGSTAKRELAVQATTDSLTGLANHRAFHERLEHEVARAMRHTHPMSLVLLDIDNFKAVNDRHGHQAGDKVLAEVARRLSALGRAGDDLGRVGGEEFAWLLPETDLASAVTAARRACHAIRDVGIRPTGTVTCSIGVATLTADDDPRSLYRRADEALYQAKSEGRDRVVVAPGDDESRPHEAEVS